MIGRSSFLRKLGIEISVRPIIGNNEPIIYGKPSSIILLLPDSLPNNAALTVTQLAPKRVVISAWQSFLVSGIQENLPDRFQDTVDCRSPFGFIFFF
jgi:hypothetical protein